jgi:DNA-binding transcriptional regulator YdaS (Cro superfamily)
MYQFKSKTLMYGMRKLLLRDQKQIAIVCAMKLLDYVKTRATQRELATKLGITPVLINQWANAKRPIPPERCVAIERATDGEVTRPELRPDDWELIWPELVLMQPVRTAGARPADDESFADISLLTITCSEEQSA